MVRPCVNANVSIVDISICISYFSYIIAFVLYTFKETSLYGNACSGALLYSYLIIVINHHNSRFFLKNNCENFQTFKNWHTKKAWDLSSVFFSSACTNLDHCEHFELYLNISSIMFFTLILCNIFIFSFVLISKKLIAIQNKTFNTHLISVL